MEIVNVVATHSWDEAIFYEELLPFCQETGTTKLAYYINCTPKARHPELDCDLQRFDRCKSILDNKGIKAGVYILTIGHSDRGHPVPELPFQKMIGVDGIENPAAHCPLDPNFQQYITECITKLAEHNPDFIMIDDDISIEGHSPLKMTCVCPLHLSLYKEMCNREVTPEALFDKLTTPSDERDRMSKEWYEVQVESLVRFARVIRNAADKVNPGIQGGICIGHYIWPYADKLAGILGGRQTPLVRLKSAIYMKDDKNTLAPVFDRIRMQLKEYPADYTYLSEADPFPHHRYSVSASLLCAYISGSLLLGTGGALMWLSHMRNWQAPDRSNYASKIRDNLGFFAELQKLGEDTKWTGPCSLYSMRSLKKAGWHRDYSKDPNFVFGWDETFRNLGVPYSFDDNEEVKLLTANAVSGFTKEEIESFLSQGGILLDGETAQVLCEMGFSEYLGIEMEGVRAPVGSEQYTADAVNGSSANTFHYCAMARDSDVKCIKPISSNVRIAAWYVNIENDLKLETTKISPSLTLFENKHGARVAVYAATLSRMGSGFPAQMAKMTFRNEERKTQLCGLISWLGGGRPLSGVVWSGVDTHVLYGENRRLNEDILAVFNLNYDPIERLVSQFSKGMPKTARVLSEKGRWDNVDCHEEGGRTVFDISAYTLKPVVLRLGFHD